MIVINKALNRANDVAINIPLQHTEVCEYCPDRFKCWTNSLHPNWVTQDNEMFTARFDLPLCVSLDYVREAIGEDNFVSVQGASIVKVDSYHIEIDRNLIRVDEFGAEYPDFISGHDQVVLTITCAMAPTVDLYE